MTAATIRIDTLAADNARFVARSGNLRAVGRTMGEALDALVSQWGEIPQTVPVIIQHFGPDRFFTQAQYDRMQELRTRIGTLSAEEQAELDALIDAELAATISRLDALDPSSTNTGKR
ncbi:MAG TPA: hypothetical protein VFB38_25550 [Chthonomonadaceae bacterium]|nr:hypothetical protein [Chthonomonadaceae bacterium]